MQALAMKSLKGTEMIMSAYRVQQHVSALLDAEAKRKNSIRRASLLKSKSTADFKKKAKKQLANPGLTKSKSTVG